MSMIGAIGVHVLQQRPGRFQVSDDASEHTFHRQLRKGCIGELVHIGDGSTLQPAVHGWRKGEKAQQVEMQKRAQPQCLALDEFIFVEGKDLLLTVNLFQQTVRVGHHVIEILPDGVLAVLLFPVGVVVIVGILKRVERRAGRRIVLSQHVHIGHGELGAIQIFALHRAIAPHERVAKSLFVVQQVFGLELRLGRNVKPVVASGEAAHRNQSRSYDK